jgi:hypothetical protein
MDRFSKDALREHDAEVTADLVIELFRLLARLLRRLFATRMPPTPPQKP